MNQPRSLPARPLPILGLLAAVGTLLLAGCGGMPGRRDGTPTPDTTALPRPTANRAVETMVTADGRMVLPLPPQPMSFSSGGEVLAVQVVAGQMVRAGEVLVQIDDGAAALAVAQAESNFTQARNALAKLERGESVSSASIEIERAKNQLWSAQAQRDAVCGRARADCDDDDVFAKEACKAGREDSQTGCDQAQANVQAMEQAVLLAERNAAAAATGQPEDIAGARAQVNQARLALEQARQDRARTALVAPFDGVVEEVNVTAGVRVAPGSPVVTLAQTRPLRFVTTNLGERNIGDIEPGAPATVTLTSFPDQPLEGTVQRIAAQGATGEGGATMFSVYIDVEPGDLPVRAGMTGRVEIEVGRQ